MSIPQDKVRSQIPDPSKLVRIRIWHSSKDGKKASVMSGLLSNRGNVGHVTIETPQAYLSMWPTRGGSEFTGKPSTFVPDPETDEKYEGHAADYLFDLYTLDVDAINEYIKTMQLVDPADKKTWDFSNVKKKYPDGSISPIGWKVVNETGKELSEEECDSMLLDKLKDADKTVSEQEKLTKKYVPRTAFEFNGMKCSPLIGDDFNEPDDMLGSPRLMAEDPFKRYSGPLRPWKVLDGGKLNFGNKAGASCASSVWGALVAGGVKNAFKTPFNMVRKLLALSPNNMVGIIADLKRQEITKHPDTLSYEGNDIISFTEKEKAKYMANAEQLALRDKINKKIKLVYEKKDKLLDVGVNPSDDLSIVIKSIDKFCSKILLGLQDKSILLDIVDRDLDCINVLYDNLLVLKGKGKSLTTEELNSFIEQSIYSIQIRQKEHYNNKGVFKLLAKIIFSLMQYITKATCDYTSTEVPIRFTAASSSQRAFNDLKNIESRIRHNLPKV